MLDNFSRSRMSEFDPSRVSATYEGWPDLAERGSEVELDLKKSYSRVFVLGMGGSAAAGDILAGWLSARGGPEMRVFKGQVPEIDMTDALVIACSASGETRETISMMEAVMKTEADMVCISSGGTVARLSAEHKLPFVQMPAVKAPRYMLPFMVFSFFAIVDKALSLRADVEAKDALTEMVSVAGKIGPDSPQGSNPSKDLAASLVKGYPKIYGSAVTRGAAVRFKSVVNENAKRHASVELMPELFHNEVEAWETKSDFVPVFLRHSREGKDVAKRCDHLGTILGARGVGPLTMRGVGKTSLSELVTLVYELDFASYYLAIALGRDPMPTAMIDQLRK